MYAKTGIIPKINNQNAGIFGETETTRIHSAPKPKQAAKACFNCLFASKIPLLMIYYLLKLLIKNLTTS